MLTDTEVPDFQGTYGGVLFTYLNRHTENGSKETLVIIPDRSAFSLVQEIT